MRRARAAATLERTFGQRLQRRPDRRPPIGETVQQVLSLESDLLRKSQRFSSTPYADPGVAIQRNDVLDPLVGRHGHGKSVAAAQFCGAAANAAGSTCVAVRVPGNAVLQSLRDLRDTYPSSRTKSVPWTACGPPHVPPADPCGRPAARVVPRPS